MWGGDENQKPLLRKYGKGSSLASFSSSDFSAFPAAGIPASTSDLRVNEIKGAKATRKLEKPSEEVKASKNARKNLPFEEALKKGHPDDKAFLSEVTWQTPDTSNGTNTIIICTFSFLLPSDWSAERAERCSKWLRDLDFEDKLFASSAVVMVHQKKTVSDLAHICLHLSCRAAHLA
jgi:hypothetical protein